MSCLLLFVAFTAFHLGFPAHSQPQSPTAGASARRALIEEYCVGCHNQKLKTADISLEGLSFSNVGSNAEIWEKVLRKLRTGQMPPPKLPRPERAAVTPKSLPWN